MYLSFILYLGGLHRWSAAPDANNHWQKADPNCGLNVLEYPPGSTPLHQIFEEYASNQQQWLDDFVPTLEKMLANGYGGNELTPGPDQYSDVYCNRVERYEHVNIKYTNCYLTSEIQSMYLVNWDYF